MANLIYNKFKQNIMADVVNLTTDTIKCMLVTSAYTPAITNLFKSDVTNEVTGTNYTAGGNALTTKVTSVDNVNNWGAFTADNVTYSNSTVTARGAVLYKDTGVASTSPLIGYIDFVTDKSSSASDFVIQWNTAGILTIA